MLDNFQVHLGKSEIIPALIVLHGLNAIIKTTDDMQKGF